MGSVIRRGITWEQFIVAWQKSETYAEAGKKLGFHEPLSSVDKSWMAQRYNKAKKMGVPLKGMPRTGNKPRVNWAALTVLANKAINEIE